jgi:hypothetical protein
MKSTKINILLIFIFIVQQAFSVSLPSHSFYDVNLLYDENEDVITTSAGTVFGRINISLSNNSRIWGDECLALNNGDKVACQECCGNKLEAAEALNGQQENTDALYETCIFDICAASPLPLGSVLSFIPFIVSYAVMKYSKKKEQE